MTKVVRVEPWQAVDGMLDGTWMRFELSDSSDGQMRCGRDEKGVYANVVSRALAAWPMRLGDMIGYARQRGKNVLAVMAQADWTRAQRVYAGHRFDDRTLRVDEPSVLVHSTTRENGESILRDGYIQCWNRLRREKRGWEAQPIGAALGDPEDFRDYVMFSGGEVSGEIVVSSKQAGRIVMDPHMPYRTGMRLYVDAQRIAHDGLLVRDGMHMKVADRLPLAPYLLFAATWENAGLAGERSTPQAFTQAANRAFERACGQKVVP